MRPAPRGLLTAIAASMITVAGVVFSITFVALSLTSSQYTSRVIRNFMRDRVNQVALGVFVGIFADCLMVLRAIRGGDEGSFVPSLAVLAGLIPAFFGIAFLIYLIHHISMSIQAGVERHPLAMDYRHNENSLFFNSVYKSIAVYEPLPNFYILKKVRYDHLGKCDPFYMAVNDCPESAF